MEAACAAGPMRKTADTCRQERATGMKSGSVMF